MAVRRPAKLTPTETANNAKRQAMIARNYVVQMEQHIRTLEQSLALTSAEVQTLRTRVTDLERGRL